MKLKKIVLAGAIASMMVGVFADDAREIVKKSNDLPSPNAGSYTVTLTLTDKKGAARVREAVCYIMKDGDTDKTVMAFRSPKDVQGVSYLTFDYPEDENGNAKDSDSWLFMPAMKKVRRIASSGSNKSDDFMGTDFTYEDMGSRALAKDDFKLLGEENIGGKSCWKIEATAKDTNEKNPRRVLYIAKDNYVCCKTEFFDKQNNLQRVMEVQDISQIDGYWMNKKIFIKNVQTNHSTLLEMKDVDYSSPVDKNLFTVNALERQAIR